MRVRAVGRTGQGPYALRGLDDHFVQAGQREQQRVVHGGQQPGGQVLGGGVAQGQHDDGVVPLGCGALGGQREAQQRYVAVTAAQLVPEPRGADGGLAGQFAGLGQGPADTAVAAEHGRFVGDREDGGEPDAEPAHGRLVALALGGGPQGRQGLDAGGVQGAPVLAATSTQRPSGAPGAAGCRVRRSLPGTLARAAASAAFWASSTTRRSR